MTDSEVATLTARLELDDADFTTKIDDAKDALDDFKTKSDNLTATLNVDDSDFKTSLESASTSLDDLDNKDVAVKISADASDATTDLQNVSTTANDLDNKNVAVKVEAEGATEAKSAIENVSTALTNLGEAAEVAGVVAAFALMAEGAIALGKAIDDDILKFADLQEASTQSALRSGQETVEGVEHASKDIMEAAEKYSVASGVEAKQLVPMLASLKQQGLDTSSYEAVKPYIDLARGMKAKPVDVENTIRTTAAQTGIQDRQRIADVFAKAYMESGLKPADIKRAMAIAQPISKQLGGFEGEVAMFSKMQQLGYNPSTVASALSMAQSEFARGGLDKRLAGAGMPQQNIDTLKSQGIISLIGGMQNKGIDFSKIFSGRQSPTLEAIATNKNAIGKLTEKMDDAKGSTELMGQAIDQDLTSSMNKAKAATEELSDTIGEQFAPLEKTLADETTTIASNISDAIKKAAAGDTTGAADALNQAIKDTVALAGKALPKTIQDALDFAGTIEDILKKIDYDYLGTVLATDLETLWDTGWAAITSEDSQTNLKNNVLDAFTSLGTGMKQILGPTFELIAMAASDAWIEIATATAPVYALLETGFQQVQHAGAVCWNALIDGAQGLANAIRRGVLNAIADVLDGLASVAEGAEGLLNAVSGFQNKINQPFEAKDTSSDNYWKDKNKHGTPGNTATFTDPAYLKYLMMELGIDPNTPTAAIEAKPNAIKGNTDATNENAEPANQSTNVFTGWKLGLRESAKYFRDQANQPYDLSGNKIPDVEPKSYEENLAERQQLISQLKNENDSRLENLHTKMAKNLWTDKTPSTPLQPKQTKTKVDVSADTSKADKSLDGLKNKAESPLSTKVDADTSQVTKSLDELKAKIEDMFRGVTEANEKSVDVTEKASNAQERYNRQIDRGQDLLKLTAESTDECCEAMSEFGKAQEAAWEPKGLGGRSYIGPSGQNYLDFLEQEAARGMYHPRPVRVGHDYSAEGKQYIQEQEHPQATVVVSADTSQFNQSLNELKTESPLSIKISADTSQAMSQIASLEARASQPVTKTIYVQEVHTGGSGGDNWGSGAESRRGIWRPPQGTTIYDPPVHRPVPIHRFGAGNTWVKEPTLAVVGDAPGGEGIFTAAQVKNMSKSITVNVGDIHITHPGASMDDIIETIGHKIAIATLGL